MESVNSLSSEQFLSGGGEMGRLIRTKDWSNTSLGSVDTWPQSLRTIVSVCLNSRFPMLVCWGKDRINIYNDSLRHLLAEEKHSVALGAADLSFWAELRDVVVPRLESVFHDGKATWSEHERLVLHRHGHAEEHYFTFSYSPIYDESGTIAGVLTAITESSKEVIKLSQSRKAAEQFVKEIFEQAPVPICILKGAGLVIEQANPFMLVFWGKAADEVVNKPIESVFPEFVDLGLISQLKNVFQNGEQYRAEEIPVYVPRAGKTERRYMSFVFKPLRNTVLNVTSVVVVGYDVTELYLAKIGAQQDADAFERIISERTSTLQNMNQELLMKNGELEQFTFLASHDLQEPLRKIQVFAGLMMHHMHMPDALEKYVSKMVASVSRMSALIQSLLDYSNISRSEYVSVQVDLNEVLELVKEDLELMISEKSCHIESGVLPVVPGNPRQLGQIFYNLIHNAIKFCDRPPVINITWHSVGAAEKEVVRLPSHADYICIDFRDNGIGFDPRYADRIFEIFRRLHDQLEYPGTGIGLALCKKIVESHHGTITAESSRSDGSKFHVYLPA